MVTLCSRMWVLFISEEDRNFLVDEITSNLDDFRAKADAWFAKEAKIWENGRKQWEEEHPGEAFPILRHQDLPKTSN